MIDMAGISTRSRKQDLKLVSSVSTWRFEPSANHLFPFMTGRTAELEESKTAETRALEAAAEKAGVKASDVEKGRREKEERDKEDETRKGL
jgi:hypothetical protein